MTPTQRLYYVVKSIIIISCLVAAIVLYAKISPCPLKTLELECVKSEACNWSKYDEPPCSTHPISFLEVGAFVFAFVMICSKPFDYYFDVENTFFEWVNSPAYHARHLNQHRDRDLEVGGKPREPVPLNNEMDVEASTIKEEDNTCKICYTNATQVLFMPCGHMCACMKCTDKMELMGISKKCPICADPYKKWQRVFR